MTDILSETRSARAALLAEFEIYLVRQRGLSPRTIYHTLRFANRFLDHHFGEATMDLPNLRPAHVIGFIEHVLATARRDKRSCPAGWCRSAGPRKVRA